MLLRINTGMDEVDGVEEIEEATLKWWDRRLSSRNKNIHVHEKCLKQGLNLVRNSFNYHLLVA